MPLSAHFSTPAPDFFPVSVPVPGTVVGYASIIYRLELGIPFPNRLALISQNKKKTQQSRWNIFPKTYLPEDSLF